MKKISIAKMSTITGANCFVSGLFAPLNATLGFGTVSGAWGVTEFYGCMKGFWN